MRIRYFAAAAQAAGKTEESLDLLQLPGATLGSVLEHLAASAPAAAPVPDGPLLRRTTSLATVLGRCSFLVNGVSEQDRSRALHPGDELDVLPPFAGG
ncbi:MoaD/ThiS family protein [Paeniglutamicibacter sp. ABSL32-1]|uniref:MoaD/ThiS family protein n=1 Tax=Paeniglutamicibacter quisquiliarum TaxID=2849498 RepID=UPI001C2D5298|nr:MoaD/ThiS family protein [Paeniglutamicibacter quisquiliarum]MBV1781379.1 MoaD/ThiS family protein [Paeniglutamicibacter quisquiliarum]